ncbi:AHH domain-containing protein [Myxococcus xanthus]|uniref:Uncharacterized protein n=1 Tax=Myxococcus xanthus TaxID=34 RepID=A0A7Y4IIX2_MYXXA|nr:AHH domain-containing protein [Myxococcus xanthus]NOJ79984.1 hypothetical protein [Myxococcus xanthus]NOJ89293.1 hypothetical protein [Myxococcus xanthus]
MSELGEGAAVGSGADDGHPANCTFCAESPRELKGYKTKHGLLKDEDELERNLWTGTDVLITRDNKVGPIYPLPGGGDLTIGWLANDGVLEEMAVRMGAAPHHIIPGKASMSESTLDQWTCAKEGMIKEDIGYSIDCANNGIFLPHLPEIYWTREISYEVEKDGVRETQKRPMAQYYGQTWEGLSPTSKQSITYLIMAETWLQVHFTDHSATYGGGSTLSYDTETKEACDQLSDLMANFDIVCERSKDGDGKRYPPYALVHRINAASQRFRQRITGHPERWKSWVSPFANAYTREIQTGRERCVKKMLIERQFKDGYRRKAPKGSRSGSVKERRSAKG